MTWIDTFGYRNVWQNKKPIAEHRKIMEENLGRKLSANEIVHHLNGDRLDNNISNLILTNRSSHARQHITKYPIVDGKKECPHCHEIKELAEYHKNRKQRNGIVAMCKICSLAYLRDKWAKQHGRFRGSKYSTHLFFP